MDGVLSGRIATVLSLLSLLVVGPAPLAAEEENTLLRSMRDDAELWAVDFVDAAHGWAAGDRGTLWRTENGGADWQTIETGSQSTWQTLHFADADNGWVAGGQHRAYVRANKGVLLRTRDGGRTWDADRGLLLPTIRKVRFFNAQQGWALTEQSDLFPAGLFFTDTGGQSWTPVVDRELTPWNVADFVDPQTAALAGSRGARGFVQRRSMQAGSAEPGLREPRAARVAADGTLWIAGDGGLLRCSRDQGVSWQSPQGIPNTGGAFDWRALEIVGSHLWVAGTPGNRILHSADAGATWEVQKTDQTLPLNAVKFIDAERGWAVGALGVILHTGDGGRTWQKQRATRTRAALMAIYSEPERIPLEVLARLAGNEGFITAVELVTRRDAEPDTPAASEREERLRAATISLGCSASMSAWGFPLRQEGLATTVEQIVEGWDRVHDGHGVERLEEHLVRQLRTWRPDVVLTTAASPSGDDPLGHLLNQIVLRAVADAADGNKFSEQIRDGGLLTWAVKKVAGSLPAGKLGTINVNTSQLAPRLGKSLADHVAFARGLISTTFVPAPNAWGSRLYLDSVPQGLGQQDFFAGITIAPGSDARRELAPGARTGADLMRQVAEKHRNLQAIVAHAERSGRGGNALLAQVNDLMRGLDPETAGQALFELAQNYYRAGQWEYAAALFQLLIERHSDHPLTVPALAWLVQYWSSGEAACRALVSAGVKPRATTARGQQIEGVIPAAAALPIAGDGNDALARARLLPLDSQFLPARRAYARELGERLERCDAQAWSDLQIQFPLAMLRGREKATAPDRFFGALSGARPHDAWWSCARGEQWLHAGRRGPPPKTTFLAHKSATKPRLDGDLSDPLWEQAERLELVSALADDADWPGTAMLAYDEEFLYLALSCRKAPQTSYEPESRTRSRDADQAGQDRVEIVLDIDRDWTTYYRLSIDQRGWTAEDCWGDASWNPRWFVAAGATDESWTVEAAIRLDELSPEPVAPGVLWALGLQRIVPGAGFQSWTRPATVTVRPQGCGYLSFD